MRTHHYPPLPNYPHIYPDVYPGTLSPPISVSFRCFPPARQGPHPRLRQRLRHVARAQLLYCGAQRRSRSLECTLPLPRLVLLLVLQQKPRPQLLLLLLLAPLSSLSLFYPVSNILLIPPPAPPFASIDDFAATRLPVCVPNKGVYLDFIANAYPALAVKRVGPNPEARMRQSPEIIRSRKYSQA